jgi:hypothetical protein
LDVRGGGAKTAKAENGPDHMTGPIVPARAHNSFDLPHSERKVTSYLSYGPHGKACTRDHRVLCAHLVAPLNGECFKSL